MRLSTPAGVVSQGRIEKRKKEINIAHSVHGVSEARTERSFCRTSELRALQGKIANRGQFSGPE